jgi:hypothetical protein
MRRFRFLRGFAGWFNVALRELRQAPFRRWLVWMAAAAFFSLAIIVLYLVTEYPDEVWSANTVDTAVISAVVIFLLVSGLVTFSMSKPQIPWLRDVRRNALGWGGAALAILTVYVAYASFRNQSMLSSEEALNDAGYQLYEIEMRQAELRCLYFNYGYSSPRRCLEELVSTPERWSLALFYVEEAWFQLKKANVERSRWGGSYAEEIRYWAQDVERDPTGMFSYYLISSEGSLEDARETMGESAISIGNPCRNFMWVWTALRQRGAEPRHVSGAARECGATGLALPVADDP